ncbi:MAG: hypothetical protein IJY94_05370 [Clostridia bacterium]|nr:hypothetical protein [Clostridia bacterium]MBQ8254916.1 hypothetical protein [Clostridia bacterium]
MEKNFEMPTLTTVVFENEDVITASGVLNYLFSFGRNALPALNPFGE